HLKVKHDLDFVVFNETGGIGNGFVLPAGILRESLSALKYADQIVVLGENDIPEEIQKYDKPVLKGFYRIKRFYDPDGKDVPLRILQNSRITLLSGIGQPKSFENTIRKSGLSFEKHFRFSDHFDYNNEQILNDLKMEMENFDHLLTTEKDFAKLKFKDISGMKIIVVEVGFELTEGSLEFASAF
ncbi:MAG: tetraacyldisaccharide 4'-kinase, partial [Candidatus Cloacimonetes bacterium]|nr:tetraacyldisaccharide 4'-kinase [Candidatus Cloacimonadota bacterium]